MLYYLIFINSLQSSLILSLRSEYGWFAALEFGSCNMALATLLSLAAFTFGMSINYGMGYFFSRYRREWPGFTESRYLAISKIFRRYIVWLLLFTPLIFFSVLTAVCGVMRVPPRMVIPLIALGRLGYYGFHYFYLHR